MNLQNDDTILNQLDSEYTERSKTCNIVNILERQALSICFLTTKEKQNFRYYNTRKAKLQVLQQRKSKASGITPEKKLA